MPTKLDVAKKRIFKAFENTKLVWAPRELEDLIRSSREQWGLAARTSPSEVIEFLTTQGKLQKLTLRAKHYTPLTRYVWGEVSSYRLAASLWKDAYLTHGSAVFLHGLTDEIPKVIYVNKEQSPKPERDAGLTQERLDMAFSREQRTSSYVFPLGELRVVLLSGKNTGALEVGRLSDPDSGAELPVTKLERTLIDIAVRPVYAGGVVHVLDAFRGAKDRVRMPVVVATLRKLGYVYPYHQSIGFLLERAGVEPRKLDPLRKMGLSYDFYLVHGMRQTEYDPSWRLHFPKGL